jgi:hypothetical protein
MNAVPTKRYDIKTPTISEGRLLDSWIKDQFRPSFRDYDIDGLVTHKSPMSLQRAVEPLGWYIKREFNYDFPLFTAGDMDKDDLVFLWRGGSHFDCPLVGACSFEKRKNGINELMWVWFHPYERRKGHLAKAWPYFCVRFGRFEVQGPWSDAMLSFMTKMNWEPGNGTKAGIERCKERTFKEQTNA